MKVNCFNHRTRKVLLEKQTEKSYTLNVIKENLNDCELLAVPYGVEEGLETYALCFFKQGQLLCIEDQRNKKFVIAWEVWCKAFFKFKVDNNYVLDIFNRFIRDDISYEIKLLTNNLSHLRHDLFDKGLEPKMLIFNDLKRIKKNFNFMEYSDKPSSFYCHVIPSHFFGNN